MRKEITEEEKENLQKKCSALTKALINCLNSFVTRNFIQENVIEIPINVILGACLSFLASVLEHSLTKLSLSELLKIQRTLYEDLGEIRRIPQLIIDSLLQEQSNDEQ